MKIFEQTTSVTGRLIPDVLYFDIETTGFIHTSSFLYMIGLFYVREGRLRRIFLFAENSDDEKQVLVTFEKYLDRFDKVCTFNGNRFDIPYVEWRCKELGLRTALSRKISVDMLEDFKPLKRLLGLERMNQKSLEVFLGLHREDRFNGGQLISLYHEYARTGDERLERVITLHNINDIEGMEKITELYAYLQIRNALFSAPRHTGHSLIGDTVTETAFPVEIDYETDCGHLNLSCHEITFEVPLVEAELKYFFENWKDYYYLPMEDLAIHRSVGAHVDPSFRKKATRQTAFAKKRGCFVPQASDTGRAGYKRDYKEKTGFVEYDEADAELFHDLYQGYVNQALHGNGRR